MIKKQKYQNLNVFPHPKKVNRRKAYHSFTHSQNVFKAYPISVQFYTRKKIVPKIVLKRIKRAKKIKNINKIKKSIKFLRQPIKVKAKNLDIRKLRPYHDKVLIYGFDGSKPKKIRTDCKGRLEVITKGALPSTVFSEEKYSGIETQNQWRPLPAQDTSIQQTFSYVICNRGNHNALVRVESSPNLQDYIIELESILSPGNTIVLVPPHFLNYHRIAVKSETSDLPTSLDIFYQAQKIG